MFSERSSITISQPLLAASGICKTFPGVQALHNAEITVRRGTLNALVGENGAGKSTLMNILAGVIRPDTGTILLDGHPVLFRSPREAQQAGISIIFQELNLVAELSVAENIFLGREPRNRLGLIDFARMRRDARRILEPLAPELDPDTSVRRLRVGAQQIVEVAKALSFEARLLIMDEPTSAVSDQEISALFRLIDHLKRQGIGIIYITHKLDELQHIADDVTIMRDGRFIDAKPLGDLTRDELVRKMVGRERTSPSVKASSDKSEAVLEVRDISLAHPQRPGDYAIRNVTFDVHRGEVVGIFGLMGAGRSELLQSIFGLNPRTMNGSVSVEGKAGRLRSPRDAMRLGIALAPEDRKSEGLVLNMSVAANASLACLDRLCQLGVLNPAREQQLVRTYTRRMSLKTPSLSVPVRTLSGGNQQKVVLSKWLATNPKVLLLDEPTRGIDVGAKSEIYDIITELAGAGMAIVVASSELPEILAIADRVLVLAEGRLTAEFRRGEATEEVVMKAALPKAKSRGKTAQ